MPKQRINKRHVLFNTIDKQAYREIMLHGNLYSVNIDGVVCNKHGNILKQAPDGGYQITNRKLYGKHQRHYTVEEVIAIAYPIFAVNHEIEKICTACQEVLPLKNFGVDPTCLACDAKERNTLPGRMKTLYNTAKTRCREWGCEPEWNAVDLLALWEKQNGKCYYSKLQMSHTAHSNWSASLERLNPKVGYILENMVLCCLELNVTAQWTDVKTKQLPLLISSNDPLPPEMDVLIPYSLRLAAQARNGAKRRALKGRIEASECTITPALLRYKMQEQKFRCATSNVPLCFEHNADWRASIERIDNTKGYIFDNVCIVAFEFNGRAQMSRAKFGEMYASMAMNNMFI